MQLIEVPTMGTVSFPDNLSDTEIAESIKRTLAKNNPPEVKFGPFGEFQKVPEGIPAPERQPLVSIPSFFDEMAKVGSAVMAPISEAGARLFSGVRTATEGNVPPANRTPDDIKAGKNMIDLPTVSPEDIKLLPKWLQGVAGVVNATTKAISGLTEPGNALIAPVAGVEGLAKPIAGAFLASAIASEPKTIQDAWRIYNDPNATTADKSEAIANAAVINPTFAALLTHGITAESPKPSLTPLTDEALKITTGGKDAIQVGKSAEVPLDTPPGNSEKVVEGISKSEEPAPAQEQAQEKVGVPEQSQPVETPTVETPVSQPAPTPPADSAIETPVTPEDATALKYKLIDQQRVARGEEPLPKPDTVGDKEVEAKADALVDKNPLLPEQLIDEINSKPRPLNSEESIVVLKKLADVKNERNLANDEVNRLAEEKAKDPSKETDWMSAKIRSAQAEENLHKVETAARYAGAEQGRAFRLRQMLVNEDFTFASLESRRRAAKGGAPITETERVELNKTAEDYKKADEALQSHLQGNTPIHPQVLAMADRIIANFDKRANAAKIRIREKLSRVSSGVDPTLLIDAVEVGVAHAARFGVDFARWSAKMIEDVGDWVKPHLKDLYDQSQKKLNGMKASDAVKRVISNPEERALKAFKTRTKNRINELETKMAEGDFSKAPKKTTVLDREAIDLQAQKDRVVRKFQQEQEKIRLKNRASWEKFLDFTSDFKRFSVLSSATVIPKLMSAGLQRLTTMPLEELIGAAWRQVPGVKQIAAKASLEGGGFNWDAEMKGFGEAFSRGAKDAYDVLKTGHSDLDVMYGKGNSSYSGETSAGTVFLEVPGRIHGAIKSPVKRAAFERAAEILGKFYAKQGLDVTDPLVKTRIAVESYKAANRSIFLEDNWLASKVKTFISANKNASPAEKTFSTLGKLALPIVKVPTNIAFETMRYALGWAKAPVRIAYALSKGMENLKPEEADAIMRDLKKGSIGAAVLALGYFNANNIGGYYQPNKKQKEGDVKYGSVRVFGHDIPSYLLHNPLIETLQIGATIRRVAESKLRKKDDEPQGIPAGIGAAAFGVVEEIPFVREMSEMDKLRNPYTRGKFLQQQGEDLVIPKIVQQGYKGATNLLNHAP